MPTEIPLCVDLDGTLITGDLLWESVVALFRRHPLQALWTMCSVLQGAARFKRIVAELVPIRPAELPYRRELVDELRALHDGGVRLWLVSAADSTYAHAVAEHLGFFEGVLASDGLMNMSGEEKAAALRSRFGEGGFEYVGNDWSDVPAWRAASRTTVVGGVPGLVRQMTAERSSTRSLSPRRPPLRAIMDAMRVHQWAKNVLIFVPLVAGHRLFEVAPVSQATLTFVAFCLCASGVYLLNDVSDVLADRRHFRKALRPVASGELSIPVALAGAAVMVGGGVSLTVLAVSWSVAGVLGGYLAVTTMYSMRLKRKPVADVFTLTSLYIVRIVAGGIATGIALSTWLMAFALFFFLGLAFVKRYVEVLGAADYLPGREYGPEDATWMQAVGTSASYMAVVVLALYVSTPEITVLYARPDLLWLLCPLLLFWLTRLWFRAGRRLVHDDPVVEALRDPQGYLLLAMAAVLMVAAA